MMYLPSNPITELLRGLFKRRVGDATLGYLGDTHGAGSRVDVPGMPGYVYVHFPNGRDATGNARYSEPTIARSGNAAYQNFPGAGVYVGYGYDGDLEIKGAQYKAMDQAGINTATLNPLNQQSKFVYEWQLTYGLASSVGNTASPSTLVTVKSFRHFVGDTFQTFETPLEADKIDLAASVPAVDEQRLAALWLDTYTNLIEVTESTAQSIDDPLDATDVQELVADRPPDAMPLKAFRLADGQVSIQQNPTTETSLRQHMATPALLGFPQVLDTRERVRPDRTFVIPGDSSIGAGSLTLETGARLLRVHKNNVASVAPAVTDDEADGYSIGSQWYDETTHLLYIATDVSTGAAVWSEAIIQHRTIASSTDTGAVGEMAIDADYFYFCSAVDTWVRVAFDATPW